MLISPSWKGIWADEEVSSPSIDYLTQENAALKGKINSEKHIESDESACADKRETSCYSIWSVYTAGNQTSAERTAIGPAGIR